LNLIHGPGGDVGEYLVTHPGITAVSFTGSFETGKRLEAMCGAIHRVIVTEMGGKNAMIVMDDADLDLAVEGAIWGGFGQPASAARRPADCCSSRRLPCLHGEVQGWNLPAQRRDGLLKETDVGPVIMNPSSKRF